MSWLTGWNYRKTIIISNSGSTLSDYQVFVTVNTSILIPSKMRSDCGDIRITDTDGSTILNYWIESGCNSSSTKILVKIPSIPTGTKTIYMYYGNSSATYNNPTGGVNTFDLFDDFNRPNSATVGNGWIEGVGQTGEISGNALKFTGLMSSPDSNIYRALDTREKIIYVETKIDSQYSNIIYLTFANENQGYNINYEKVVDQNRDRIQLRDGLITKATTNISTSLGTWYSIEIIHRNDYSSEVRIWPTIGGSRPSSPTVSYGPFTPTYTNQNIALEEQSYLNYVHWFDNLRVRKYASPEPTLSTVGIEELPPIFDTLTIAGD